MGLAYPWGFYIFAAVAAIGAVCIALVNRNPAPDEPMPLTEDEADRIGARHLSRRRRGPAGTTVRDATFDVFRRFGMTTIFANPGSTEIAFLTDLPDDLRVRPGAARGLGRRDRHRLRDGDAAVRRW